MKISRAKYLLFVVRARPLIIWGGAEKIEKKKFEGPSPGKKIQEAFLEKKNLKMPSRGKNFLKRLQRGKKIVSDIFSAPQIINGRALKTYVWLQHVYKEHYLSEPSYH